MTPNKDVWTFSASEARVGIEDSVYLAGNQRAKRAAQLVIEGQAHATLRVAWRFDQADPSVLAAAAAHPGAREEEPKLRL